MQYDTAFRPYLAKRIEQIESADIVVGIPCYNNDATIVHVLKQVSHGLAKHYKSARSVILISDGGSTDDTLMIAAAASRSFRHSRRLAGFAGRDTAGSELLPLS